MGFDRNYVYIMICMLILLIKWLWPRNVNSHFPGLSNWITSAESVLSSWSRAANRWARSTFKARLRLKLFFLQDRHKIQSKCGLQLNASNDNCNKSEYISPGVCWHHQIVRTCLSFPVVEESAKHNLNLLWIWLAIQGVAELHSPHLHR